MRRLVPGLILPVIAIAAFAGQGLRYEVRTSVERALANERAAIARYDAFAVKAAEEGYPGAAALFRAAARGEKVHAARFARVLRQHGHAVPEPDPQKPAVGSTEDNLRTAASSEMAERDGMYKEGVEICTLHGAKDVAAVFNETRDAEVEHGNLCAAAVRNPALLKSGRTYYVCAECGYTTDIRLPLCPSCRKREPPEAVE